VATPEKDWLSLAAAQAYSSLSKRSLRRLIQTGRLTAYRPMGGRKILLERRQLDEAIRSTATPRRQR
jgi:excisionase family DNA binding protein